MWNRQYMQNNNIETIDHLLVGRSDLPSQFPASPFWTASRKDERLLHFFGMVQTVYVRSRLSLARRW